MKKEPTKDDIIKAYSNEIIRLTKWVRSLREQLNEANAIIDIYFPKDKKINAICVKPINDYRKKWGVK